MVAARNEEKVSQMKRDWKLFSELKRTAQLRHQEIVGVKEFEPNVLHVLMESKPHSNYLF